MEKNTEKKYELQELSSKHLFAMFRLISKFGINEFKDIFKSVQIGDTKGETDKEKLAGQVGMEIMFGVAGILVTNIGKCEKEVYEFLSAVSNLEPEAVASLRMDELTDMIVELVNKEEFKGFFLAVSKLFK